VLLKELPPVGILRLAEAHERLDRIEVKAGLSLAAGLVGGEKRIELPEIRFLGAVM
jgi:hypothetical protein